MGSGHIVWKFELDQIIFLDFTGIESFKYKEISVSGAKLVLRSIVTETKTRDFIDFSVLDIQVLPIETTLWLYIIELNTTEKV